MSRRFLKLAAVKFDNPKLNPPPPRKDGKGNACGYRSVCFDYLLGKNILPNIVFKPDRTEGMAG
jgi:hypothetical protein